jgi:hypothetical protein
VVAVSLVTLKPGLWKIESQSSLHGQAFPTVNTFLSLGPQALQDHIQNMLRQNRMRIHEDGTATICLTAQQIAQNRFIHDEGSGCTLSKGQRKGNNIQFAINCEVPKGSGQTYLEILSKTYWTASTQVNVTVRGMAQPIGNESSGTWLSATCPAGQ